MLSSTTRTTPYTIHDLLPGDIIFFKVHGMLHVGIYAPIAGEQSDLIQMNYDMKRSGAIKSTLSKQLEIGRDVRVLRSKCEHIKGIDIAAQAEFWLRQGIVYDERRFARTLYEEGNYTNTSEEFNILQYLKFAARRETMPIKVREYPYNYTSYLTGYALSCLAPQYNYSRPMRYLFSSFVEYNTSSRERPKGMRCMMLAILCIAAVALKDEIQPVNGKTGWVSLKYSRKPELPSTEFTKVIEKVRSEIDAYNFDGPGLADLLTEEQTEEFNLTRIKEKLTAGIAALNPFYASQESFLESLVNDKSNWVDMGILDMRVTKKFDKAAFDKERQAIQDDIQRNRQAFIEEFGVDIFNRDHIEPERQYTVYKK